MKRPYRPYPVEALATHRRREIISSTNASAASAPPVRTESAGELRTGPRAATRTDVPACQPAWLHRAGAPNPPARAMASMRCEDTPSSHSNIHRVRSPTTRRRTRHQRGATAREGMPRRKIRTWRADCRTRGRGPLTRTLRVARCPSAAVSVPFLARRARCSNEAYAPRPGLRRVWPEC